MFFYEVKVDLLNINTEPERNERVDKALAVQSKTEMLFLESKKACHMAVSAIMYRKRKANVCVAIREGTLENKTVEAFLKAADLDVDQIDIQEITLEAYWKMLHLAQFHDFVDNEDAVLYELGISALGNRHGRTRHFISETVLSETKTKEELLTKSGSMLCGDCLHVEIERIYQGAKMDAVTGHPVHYMLMTDSHGTRDAMLAVLLTALYQNKRIQSRRYTLVEYSNSCDFNRHEMKTLYESCTGGTIVVSYSYDDHDDSEYVSSGIDVVSGLCSLALEYRNKVLTVFCLERNTEKIRTLFLEHVGAMTIVPITQETAFNERALSYLHAKAKECNMRPNKALSNAVLKDKGFTADDLNQIFDEWYDKQIKTKVYTQYAQLDTANKQVAARKPKGSAIEELEQMIGLTEAKRVIHQALDFYKAQNIFKSKGFLRARPAMHMVFTGNPGTAKTTVARLFAQILKDNNLLSVGGLLEVGRADLVGKFVGWTAQKVKAKFDAAVGSVLFIDEAYSLVDDRNGSYGDEAINTIVQEMENHREDMIVIFAGYPDKMEGFLERNPGLRSRVGFHVPFTDYNVDELVRITELIARKNGVLLGDGVQSKLIPIFESARINEDFGNGRYARNLFEKALMRQASRLVAMDLDTVTSAEVQYLHVDDFEMPAIESGAPMRRIGFALREDG